MLHCDAERPDGKRPSAEKLKRRRYRRGGYSRAVCMAAACPHLGAVTRRRCRARARYRLPSGPAAGIAIKVQPLRELTREYETDRRDRPVSIVTCETPESRQFARRAGSE